MKSNAVFWTHWPVLSALLLSLSTTATLPGINVLLTETPDYGWDAGCFGTASGNLMGYWDRHGFPEFYTGPTAGGIAPLTSGGPNDGIRALWATRAGLDGRPADQFGHLDDYWVAYESTDPDPFVTAGRAEHAPDCIGDFIGLNQNKWSDLNGECEGNIDGFSFVFWEPAGGKRINFVPESQSARPLMDIPSGLRSWARSRGSDAEVFSQLVDFNPTVAPGQGFTFEDLKAEINGGYPVLLYLQNYDELHRVLPGMPRANPNIHGMLAFGYYESGDGERRVRYKTSWGGSGDYTWSTWEALPWQANLPVRGVIGFHPQPKITKLYQDSGALTVEWEAPASVLSNIGTGTSVQLHSYVLERATSLGPADFQPVSEPTTERRVTLRDCCPDEAAFYRVRLMPPGTLE